MGKGKGVAEDIVHTIYIWMLYSEGEMIYAEVFSWSKVLYILKKKLSTERKFWECW